MYPPHTREVGIAGGRDQITPHVMPLSENLKYNN